MRRGRHDCGQMVLDHLRDDEHGPASHLNPEQLSDALGAQQPDIWDFGRTALRL